MATLVATKSVSLEHIEACGVVGAGGGGFPTATKLKARADTIILNGAECEPLLHKDKELLRAFPEEILAGLAAAGALVGAERAIVGIKGKYHDVIDDLRPLLPEGFSLAELSDSYPAGDEFILVYDTTGRIIPPGKIPLAVGCVVINVETALNIARARPVTRKYLTVAGAVNHPATIDVPLGITLEQCLSLAGGASVPNPVVLVGGAMMGRYSCDLTEPVTKTTGGLIVLPQEHPLVARYAKDYKTVARIGASCCDQCTFCTFFCPRYLLGHPVEPHKAMRALGYQEVGKPLILGTSFCCECNLCTMMACPEDLDPKAVMVHHKRQLAADQQRWNDPPTHDARAELSLNDRRVPIPRLIRKLGLANYTNKGPLTEVACNPARVTLPLKQHAGVPAVPTVAVGQTVQVGDVIARPAAGQLGATLHASLAGRITALQPAIVIERAA